MDLRDKIMKYQVIAKFGDRSKPEEKLEFSFFLSEVFVKANL